MLRLKVFLNTSFSGRFHFSVFIMILQRSSLNNLEVIDIIDPTLPSLGSVPHHCCPRLF